MLPPAHGCGRLDDFKERNGTAAPGRPDVEFGPGFGTHEFGGHYSGEEVNASGYTVYLNEYTPFEKTVDIRLVAAGNRDLQ